MAYFCDMDLALYPPYLLYIIPVIGISVYSVTYSIVFNHKVVTGLGKFCDMAPGMGGIKLIPFGVHQMRILEI